MGADKEEVLSFAKQLTLQDWLHLGIIHRDATIHSHLSKVTDILTDPFVENFCCYTGVSHQRIGYYGHAIIQAIGLLSSVSLHKLIQLAVSSVNSLVTDRPGLIYRTC